ncbi:aminoglycoside phosphotransferase family protein [Occultella gossypii]|uniref:Aminoglycoside phosphotransferase n=1 Tax=Occultella gossypii TaxID=2800820 RepID=A0ABS7S6K6_9MICO|nr:aminoglycoside phosphotransferase family protein [Occultella gossypii]MBZ2195370.1 aminoglycoside phosphotransferase [Occultella gossypii]
MKILPDSPNLDHLRRQAKDLLAGLRDGEPTASLADAQAALAWQYGFRAWPDLKAEVEGRRGGGDVAPSALAAAIAERYALGTVTGQMRSVQRSDDLGHRWVLDTDRCRWSVSSVENWWPIVDAARDVELQEAAAAAGVQLPLPVRSRTGAVVEEIDGAPWRVTQWRHSGPPLAAPVAARITASVGAILATIHGLRFEVDRISPWHAARLSDEPWAQVAVRIRSAGVPWADAFDAAVGELESGSRTSDRHRSTPRRRSSPTTRPAKVRREHDGSLVVVGWEHAGGQPPAWELADVLATWTIDPSGAVNLAGARALVEGYASVADGVPHLDEAAFRGFAMSMCNYVGGQVDAALEAHRAAMTTAGRSEAAERDFTARSVTHLLTHLTRRSAFVRLLEATALVR